MFDSFGTSSKQYQEGGPWITLLTCTKDLLYNVQYICDFVHTSQMYRQFSVEVYNVKQVNNLKKKILNNSF